MFLEQLGHLSYVRERAHGHVFIVRCKTRDDRHIAGRLSYVPHRHGSLNIEGTAYRKVEMRERSMPIYPLLSAFARDSVHLIPVHSIDRVWDPFGAAPADSMANAALVARFFAELTAVAQKAGGKAGLIGSRLVGSGGIDATSDYDLAVNGAAAWAASERLVGDWIARGAARAVSDNTFYEFEERRVELRLSAAAMHSLRRTQWWRKLGIGSHLLSLSCSTDLGVLPGLTSGTTAEVQVRRLAGYVPGCAPYIIATSTDYGPVAGALHLSWFLRQGFEGKATGSLVMAWGKQWVWIAAPEQVQIDE